MTQIRELPTAPQPPLSHPGARPDSGRAKRPPLAEPPATDQELSPGDRVEGLGNFGKPTGEFGTVERQRTKQNANVSRIDQISHLRLFYDAAEEAGESASFLLGVR